MLPYFVVPRTFHLFLLKCLQLLIVIGKCSLKLLKFPQRHKFGQNPQFTNSPASVTIVYTKSYMIIVNVHLFLCFMLFVPVELQTIKRRLICVTKGWCWGAHNLIQIILNMILKLRMDRKRPQYHTSTKMESNTTWRQVTSGSWAVLIRYISQIHKGFIDYGRFAFPDLENIRISLLCILQK